MHGLVGDHALIDGDFKLNFENRSISISSLFAVIFCLLFVWCWGVASMGPVWTYSSGVQGVTRLLLLPSDHCLLQTRYFNTITRPGYPGHWRSTPLGQNKLIGQKGLKNKRQCEKCWICFGFFSYCPVSVNPDTDCSGQSVHSHNLGVSQHELYRILDMFGWNVAIRYPGVWQPNSIECILVDGIWWWPRKFWLLNAAGWLCGLWWLIVT